MQLLTKVSLKLANEIQFYGISEIRLHLLVELLETMMQSVEASSKDCRPIAPHTPPTLPAIGRQHPCFPGKALANPPLFPPYGPRITVKEFAHARPNLSACS
jgi:hypothetical protein